jgi:putative transposase
MDLHSRRVIGWAVSDYLKRALAIRALKMAIALRSPPRGCVFHSDRGNQYCSHEYQKILRDHGLQASMSGKGNCYEIVRCIKRYIVREVYTALCATKSTQIAA